METNRPNWMEDEQVKNIAPEKLRFLEQLFLEGHGKSQKEMLAYLMPMIQKARKENLTLTPQEVSAAINAIKKYSTAEELRKMEAILEKGGQKPRV